MKKQHLICLTILFVFFLFFPLIGGVFLFSYLLFLILSWHPDNSRVVSEFPDFLNPKTLRSLNEFFHKKSIENHIFENYLSASVNAQNIILAWLEEKNRLKIKRIKLQHASKIILDSPKKYHKLKIKPITYVDENGYKRFLDSNVLVHRYVANKKLGRWINKDEVVHHIDGNKKNNNRENLLVCTQDEHDRIHRRNLRTTGSWYGLPEY